MQTLISVVGTISTFVIYNNNDIVILIVHVINQADSAVAAAAQLARPSVACNVSVCFKLPDLHN